MALVPGKKKPRELNTHGVSYPLFQVSLALVAGSKNRQRSRCLGAANTRSLDTVQAWVCRYCDVGSYGAA